MNISDKEISKRKKMEKIFSFIHENYKNEISFEIVAKIIDVSEIYFGRIFKEYTGLKFTDYLNIYRTNQAAKILVNTDIPIHTAVTPVANQFIPVTHFGQPPSSSSMLHMIFSP